MVGSPWCGTLARLEGNRYVKASKVEISIDERRM
jgi:hypothetical protein